MRCKMLPVVLLASALGASGGACAEGAARGAESGATAEIRVLADQLSSPDARQRATAACELGLQGIRAMPVMPQLLAALADETPVEMDDCSHVSFRIDGSR